MSYDTGATSSQQYRLQRSTFLSPPLPSAPPPPLAVLVIIALSTASFPRSLARDEQAVGFRWKERVRRMKSSQGFGIF